MAHFCDIKVFILDKMAIMVYTEFEFSENKFSKGVLNVCWKERRIKSNKSRS